MIRTTAFAAIVIACAVPGSIAWAQDGDEAMAAALTANVQTTATSEAATRREFRGLDEEVQDLKEAVLDLNRDLFLLEEELLFPANSQVAFFVSMDVGEYFGLDAVSLQVDGKEIANYLYTDREVDALIRGGVHRLHMENMKVGDHELVAVFTGRGPNWRDYRRGATLSLSKSIGAKYVELQITDSMQKQQPEFQIKEWE